jgi:hypothetical protein
LRKYIILALLAALVLSACDGVTITETAVGPIQTATISVPAPDAEVANVHLQFGASDSFKLRPGADALVEGTVRYNVEEFKPTIATSGDQVTIDQSSKSVRLSNNIRNEWDLRLSDAIPLSLSVNAGAYRGSYDLGGLLLRGLHVEQGAAESTYDFGKPNREVMEQLLFSSGLASVEMNNLANANAAEMRFEIGAGNYTLDFGGTLARTAKVNVEAGTSNLTIRVPHGTPARVTLDGVATGVDVDGFAEAGQKQYINAAWDEAQPHVEITLSSAVGSVKLASY